ncbi:unnamed protein product, partial [Laminaria digitata]
GGADDGGGGGDGDSGGDGGISVASALATAAKSMAMAARSERVVSGPVPGLGPRPFPERISESFAQERDGEEGGRGEDALGFSGAEATAGVPGAGAAAGLSGVLKEPRTQPPS